MGAVIDRVKNQQTIVVTLGAGAISRAARKWAE